LISTDGKGVAKAAAAPPAAAPAPAAPKPAPAPAAAAPVSPLVMPAARKVAADAGINTAAIAGTGKDGRVTKGDVLSATTAPAAAKPTAPSGPRSNAEREERVRMTRLRKRIAERLKEAQ